MPTAIYQSFEKEKKKMLEDSMICTGSRLAFFWSGEHSVVDGGIALVSRIPQEVIVAIRGKMALEDAEREDGPKIETPKAINPVTEEFDEDVSDPFKSAEELKDLSETIRDLPEEVKEKIEYLPAEIEILSTTPPGRGCNFSGAFASALATAILLLNGERLGFREGQANWAVSPEGVFEHPKFQEVFRYAMKIETIAHEDPSGYGPLFGLLHGERGPFLFSPVNDEDNVINQACLSSWMEDTNPLGEESELRILVVDTGIPKSTKKAINASREREEEIVKFSEDFYSYTPTSTKELKTPLLEETKSPPGPLHRALDCLSIIMINSVKRYCREITDDNFQEIIQVVRTIDKVHGLMELHWEPYLTLRDLLYCRYGEKVGCKLTGGGGGGDFVIFTQKELIPDIRKTISAFKVGIIYDSTSDEPPTAGTKLYKWTDPEAIGPIKHYNPLHIITMTSQGADLKETTTAKKYTDLLKEQRKLKNKKSPPKRLVVADKNSGQLALYQLKEQLKYHPTELNTKGLNIRDTIKLLWALATEGAVSREKPKINSEDFSWLGEKVTSDLRSNITSRFGRQWVSEGQRNPLRVNERGLDVTVSLTLPPNCALIAISVPERGKNGQQR